ncbi:GNAT family N-acetyltransferase [Myroides sp. NP-2]|uniref:GNAT family N-acetyltransferase n=1 Tax=Myroides sp. NP-2 TaxID=2759945 RepID=UPI0015FDEFD1|nr:GNAT family N-acetyltransferase [Myroides sp. NP-2]MBB1150451.1 GNAT family N-acetyltransferase [Myroides sp. NP-2]
MKLTTDRLILRPWALSDAEDLFRYAKDEQIGPAAGWPAHSSVEESITVIEEVFSKPEIYALALKENNRAIGCIGLLVGEDSHLPISSSEGEVAYWLGVPFWGQGLIPEALEAIIAHSFENLAFTDLWCVFYEDNEKSRRAQEKCGFKHSHRIENQRNEATGDYCVEYVSRLTKKDWLANR